jgi:hypothetical protein
MGAVTPRFVWDEQYWSAHLRSPNSYILICVQRDTKLVIPKRYSRLVVLLFIRQPETEGVPHLIEPKLIDWLDAVLSLAEAKSGWLLLAQRGE